MALSDIFMDHVAGYAPPVDDGPDITEEVRKAIMTVLPLKFKEKGIDYNASSVQSLRIESKTLLGGKKVSMWVGQTCVLTAEDIASMANHCKQAKEFASSQTPFPEKKKKWGGTPLIDKILGKNEPVDPWEGKYAEDQTDSPADYTPLPPDVIPALVQQLPVVTETTDITITVKRSRRRLG